MAYEQSVIRRRHGRNALRFPPYTSYMLASKPYGTLYTGTTSDLVRRIWEHKNKVVPGFTKRYGVHQLVWFEAPESRDAGIAA